MSETIDEITISYEEEGEFLVEELDKAVLTRGAWTTILFLYREKDKKTGDWTKPKAGLRRYQKYNGVFRKRDAINITEKNVDLLVQTLGRWFRDKD